MAVASTPQYVIYPLVYNAHPSSYRVVRQPVYQRNTQNVHHLNKSNVDCQNFRFRLVHYSYLRLRRVMMAWLCRMGTDVHMAIQMKLYLTPNI
jgi:hypothetical protein